MSRRAEQGAEYPEHRAGVLVGIVCYFVWGFAPLVLQPMGRLGIPVWEILANRAVWCVPAALGFVLVAGQWREVRAVARKPVVMAWLAVSAFLLAFGWVLFTVAVNTGRVLETSLGYYIDPLLAIAVGAIFFRERIDRFGAAAIVLAVLGVAVQTAALGRLPVISLALALSFGAYGVVRKLVEASAQAGMLIESLYLLPVGGAYILWLAHTGAGRLGVDPTASFWLLICGPVLSTPLVMFAWSARRIPLSTIGFLQFIGPTIAFFIGMWQGEPLTMLRIVSFVLIWASVVVFAWGAWRQSRIALLATELSEPAE